MIEIETTKDSQPKILKISGKDKFKKTNDKNLKVGVHKLLGICLRAHIALSFQIFIIVKKN